MVHKFNDQVVFFGLAVDVEDFSESAEIELDIFVRSFRIQVAYEYFGILVIFMCIDDLLNLFIHEHSEYSIESDVYITMGESEMFKKYDRHLPLFELFSWFCSNSMVRLLSTAPGPKSAISFCSRRSATFCFFLLRRLGRIASKK